MKQIGRHHRAADMRAALVAATIANVHRRKGSPAIKPEAFLRGPRRLMTIKEARQALGGWAKDINASVKKKEA